MIAFNKFLVIFFTDQKNIVFFSFYRKLGCTRASFKDNIKKSTNGLTTKF